MTVSFEPLKADAINLLWRETDVDFSGQHLEDWFNCTVRNERGVPIAVALGEFKSIHDVHFTAVILEERAISRRLLRTIFSTLFHFATRITALVEPRNVDAIDRVRRLGFQYEGFLRMGISGGRDALIYGMLRDDCLYLPGRALPPIHTTQQLELPLRLH